MDDEHFTAEGGTFPEYFAFNVIGDRFVVYTESLGGPAAVSFSYYMTT